MIHLILMLKNTFEGIILWEFYVDISLTRGDEASI